MSKRATVRVDDQLITVQGHNVFQSLRAAGWRPIYVSTLAGFCMDRRHGGVDRLPDVMAALEAAGYDVAQRVGVQPGSRP